MAATMRMEIGTNVLVGSSAATSKKGIIRFIGETHFATGEWVGVELIEKEGKNDGSLGDERYFTCEPDHGIFVRRVCICGMLSGCLNYYLFCM